MFTVTTIAVVAAVLALIVFLACRINHKTNVIFSEFVEKNIVQVLQPRVSMPEEEIRRNVKKLLEGGQVQGLDQLRRVSLWVESLAPNECRTLLDVFVEKNGQIHKISVKHQVSRDSLPTEIVYELIRNEGKAQFELLKAR
ncbi:MAG: hypothetical protein K6C40_15765 [Thermoguttaceae bacterium]|nr:hypothetical protein [Thermoguttaceae bacterium]